MGGGIIGPMNCGGFQKGCSGTADERNPAWFNYVKAP